MRLDDNLRTDRFLHAELARLVEGMGLSGALLEQQQAHLHGAIVLLVTRVPIGGESTHPQRDLPRAVFGAFLVCTVIYIAVQVAFIGALPPSLLSHYASWTRLATDPHLSRGPFFVLASLIGLAWLAWILRFDAVVSPSGTGLLYLTGASRLSFGLSRDGYVPKLFLVEDGAPMSRSGG
ncbi:MAG TPA: APC family permease [Acidimicrobiales bacterium]|nr:APC family permease [Acidimicrobiales bacterium]